MLSSVPGSPCARQASCGITVPLERTTIFTAASARGSALGAMLGAPPAAETGPHPRLAPHEFKLFLGLSPDYQILYFRSQLRDDAVDSDKTS
mmetsp:Transcript_33590/g.117766  ORF Transcript_33590/g.117766 Transcript_33590/m.117766 type:complete len:92 (+) Transcript_33590:619-894(+)